MGDSGSEGLSARGDDFGGEHLEKGNPPGSSSPGEIRKAVEQCLLSSSRTLDVSGRNIEHLTDEMHRQPRVKYFHLKCHINDSRGFISKQPRLVWLDLRYNKITALPPGVGHHRQLKTLLLEKNPIKELPAELGNVTSLTALNLRHCPLGFPPKDAVRKGLKRILRFLRGAGRGALRLCWGAREPPESVVSREPNPCVPHDPHTAVEGTAAVEKLNLGELLQCGLDLSGEWPNEEEEPSLERLSGATLQGTWPAVGTWHKAGTRRGEQHSASPDRPPR